MGDGEGPPREHGYEDWQTLVLERGFSPKTILPEAAHSSREELGGVHSSAMSNQKLNSSRGMGDTETHVSPSFPPTGALEGPGGENSRMSLGDGS